MSESDDVVWWEGRTACTICGWSGWSVIPITKGLLEPIVAMECSDCGNFTVHPVESE